MPSGTSIALTVIRKVPDAERRGKADDSDMNTTLNAIGGFILAAIIAVALVGNLNFATVNLANASAATHWTGLFVIVTALGLRGIARR